MSKKHFIYGAEYVVWYCQNYSFSKDFQNSVAYRTLVALFTEFGKEFNKDKFDLYISKRLTNNSEE